MDNLIIKNNKKRRRRRRIRIRIKIRRKFNEKNSKKIENLLLNNNNNNCNKKIVMKTTTIEKDVINNNNNNNNEKFNFKEKRTRKFKIINNFLFIIISVMIISIIDNQNNCLAINQQQSLSIHSFTYSPKQQQQQQEQQQQSTTVSLDKEQDLHAIVAPSTLIQQSSSLLLLQKRQIDIDNNNKQQLSNQINCQMPITWTGKWYQRGIKDAIKLTNNGISDKGLCRQRKGDKYLFENTITHCRVCMVIIERHLNVLQYKESLYECLSNSSSSSNNESQLDESQLDRLCSEIAGDAQLDTLFRIDTPPIECPILGRYQFTYDNCRDPVSSLESCTDKRQLNFRFNACPDVIGSEVKTEILKCYADWSEGSNYYMIGRLESASNGADRNKFRCYIYERINNDSNLNLGSSSSFGYLMSQSQDESCDGLFSATDGPRSMRIISSSQLSNTNLNLNLNLNSNQQINNNNNNCQFPSYLSEQENWLHVDNSLIYIFQSQSQSSNISSSTTTTTTFQVKETKEGNIIEESQCIKQLVRSSSSSSSSVFQQQQTTQINSQQYEQFLIQTTKNCQTLNYCIRIYRRASGLVQIEFYNYHHHHQQNNHNYNRHQHQDELTTCATSSSQKPSFTITLTNAEYQPCPFNGVFSVIAPADTDLTYNPSNIFMCPRQSLLMSQCDDPTRISVHSSCSAKIVTKNLYCQGSWTWQHVTRLLLSDDDRQRYFLTYRESNAQHEQTHMILPHASRLQFSHNTNGQLQLQSQQTQSQQIIEMSILPIVPPRPTITTSNNNPTIQQHQIRPTTVRLARRGICTDMLMRSPLLLQPNNNILIGGQQTNNFNPFGSLSPSIPQSSIGAFQHSTGSIDTSNNAVTSYLGTTSNGPIDGQLGTSNSSGSVNILTVNNKFIQIIATLSILLCYLPSPLLLL